MGEQPLGMKVVWLRRALRNLEDAATWIAQDNPPAAARVVAQIKQATEQLVIPTARIADASWCSEPRGAWRG
jgi:plasmid stabilization system protein ParE